MTDNNFIFQHWKKEQQVFNKNFATLKKHNEKEAVHDLRVAVKKLRATIELYVLLTKEPLWENPLKETDELFNISGKQRDIEMALEVLGTLEKETGKKFPELKRHLQVCLSIAVKWTNISINEYKKKELAAIAILIKDEKSFHNQEEIKYKIIALINDSLEKSKNYFKQPHKLRQYLKEIYYWIRMLPVGSKVINEYEKELHHVLDDLGHWQDLAMLELKIKHYRKDYLPKAFSEYDSIKSLQETIQAKEKELLKSALMRIRKMVSKLQAMEKEKRSTAVTEAL